MRRSLRFLSLLLLLPLLLLPVLFLLSGCKAQADEGGVVVSNFICYDFVRTITDGSVSVTMLLPAGTDPHRYDPSIKDLITLCDAELFVYGGGESDAWAKTILSDHAPSRVFSLMDQVELLHEESPVEAEANGHAYHDHDHGGAEYDEHIWTSPKNAIRIVTALTEELSACYPERSDAFRANAAAYCEKLTALDLELEKAVAGGARRLLVFGDRFPLLYFVRAYGLEYEAAFSGCASQTETDPATVRRLIDTVASEKIPVVFTIEMSAGTVADCISEATGAQKRTFYACHTISAEDLAAGKTYLDFMYHNLAVLQEALAPCPN